MTCMLTVRPVATQLRLFFVRRVWNRVLCLCGIDYLCMDPGTMGALSESNEPPKVASFREKVGARPVSQFESLKNQEDFDAHIKASDLLSEEFPKWIQYFIDGANSLDDYLKSRFG